MQQATYMFGNLDRERQPLVQVLLTRRDGTKVPMTGRRDVIDREFDRGPYTGMAPKPVVRIPLGKAA